MVNICEYASNARQHGCKAHNRVQRRHHLRELRRSDASSKQCANEGTDACDAGELGEDFWRESDGEERRKDAGGDAQYAENVALSCCLLRCEAGERALNADQGQ